MTRKKIQITQADNGLIVRVIKHDCVMQILVFENVADFGKWFAEFWKNET